MATYGRWASSPVGAGLVAREGGQVLAPLSAGSLSRMGRSDVSVASGAAGVEFFLWGDDPQTATVGLCTATAPLSSELGTAAGGIGWRVHAGQIVRNGSVAVSGLPVPKKGVTLGVRVVRGAPSKVEFYSGGDLVGQADFSNSGAYYFAASLASSKADGIQCAVNAGRWQGLSPAVLDGWQVKPSQVAPLLIATEDYMTLADDDPGSQAYAGIIAGDSFVTYASVSFWMWSSESRSGAAQVRVYDADGSLDTFARGDFRDSPVFLRRVNQRSSLQSASALGRFVLERVEVESDSVKRFVLRDAHADLNAPLTLAPFLPLHGATLAWQAQPAVIGFMANVPGIAINSDGSCQFLTDSRIGAVKAVRDRGIPLQPGTGYGLSADGTQLILNSPPSGQVTADVSSESGAYSATLEQLLKGIFSRIGKAAWAGADAREIDRATGYAGGGLYVTEASTARDALATVLPSYAADWWQDGEGVLRLARLVDPISVADSDLAFDLDFGAMAEDLIATADLAPNLSRRMYYGPNAVALDASDLATDVVALPAADRNALTSPYRGQVYGAGQLAACYRHADGAEPVASVFADHRDAQLEIDRVLALFSGPRFFYSVRLKGRVDLDVRPGQVGRVTYPRYGLNAGRKLLVVGITSNPVTGEQTLKLWGA